MPFFIEKGDLITKEVDCIVNASNVNLSMVEGVGRAIFHKAGDVELARACKKIGHCSVGDAVTTPSFGIQNTKLLIHAVGPIFINGKHNEEKNLRSAYLKSLNLVLENNFSTVAFPLLSGEFNYPLKECYETAEDEILTFLKDHNEMVVHLVMYKNFPEIVNEEKQLDLKKYVQSNQGIAVKEIKSRKKFSSLLKSFISDKKMLLEDVSYKSNIKLSTLKKILSDSIDSVSKETIFALGIGLELSKVELNSLLMTKGFVIENTSLCDLIISYFVDNKIYNVFEINRALFHYGFVAIGCEK